MWIQMLDIKTYYSWKINQSFLLLELQVDHLQEKPKAEDHGYPTKLHVIA